ncbi:adenylosuccinate synthetase, partial [Acinetobacter baumannii]
MRAAGRRGLGWAYQRMIAVADAFSPRSWSWSETPEGNIFAMANVVVVGAQWGDEGKGKIVDWLSEQA